MPKKQTHDLFGDDEIANATQSQEFAKLLGEEKADQPKLKPGSVLRGEILTIGTKEAFVSTGTPIDGALPIRDLLDKDNQVVFKVGDIIEVKIVRVGDAEILLKRVGANTSSADVEDLQDAYELELPVDGKVTETVKGGFRVEIMGKPAFCPISQMDFHVGGTDEYIGKRFLFLVTKFDQNGRNLVVSRRRLLDLQKAESEGDFIRKQKKGDIFQGKITRVERYGAFVEIHGSIQGLIPISEMAWSRVGDPNEIVTVGQNVQVMLLEAIELEGRLKISFSLKQGGGEGDPWLRVANEFPVGRVFEGTIERKEAYGLFVNLIPGVTGLLPRSKWNDAADAQSFDRKKKGEKLLVQVDEVRFEEKRISLAPPSEKDDLSWKAHSSSNLNAGKGFGSLGDLLKQAKPKK